MAVKFVAVTSVQQDSGSMPEKQRQLLCETITNLEYQFEQQFSTSMRKLHSAAIDQLSAAVEAAQLLDGLRLVVADVQQPRGMAATAERFNCDDACLTGVRSISQEMVEQLELHQWIQRLEAAMRGAEPLLQCLDALCEDYRSGYMLKPMLKTHLPPLPTRSTP